MIIPRPQPREPATGHGRARRQSPRLAIKVKGTILFIDPTVVVAVRAEGNCVLLQKESTSYHLRESISALSGERAVRIRSDSSFCAS